MLARLQQLLVLCVLGSALVWGASLTALGYPRWALVGALVILLGHAALLGIECVLSWLVQGEGPPPRPGVGTALRAWAVEALEVIRVFFWRQPFRSKAEPDHLPAGGRGRHGAVFVHGFVCNRGLWNPLLRVLRSTGTPFIAINLEPVFGSIDDYAEIIERAVADMEAATSMPVTLVGHSMGGLAIRAWLVRFDADARVRRVVTIATPHRGTWLARHGRAANAKQMRLNDPWLTRLAEREPASRYERFTCFYGNCDNIVFPAPCATLDGARNVHVPATAHVHMAFRPEIMAELELWLRAHDPPAAEAAQPPTMAP